MSAPDLMEGPAPAEAQAPHAVDHEQQYQGLQPGSYTDQKLVGQSLAPQLWYPPPD